MSARMASSASRSMVLVMPGWMMTSAPIHASVNVHDVPDSNCVKSMTRTPVNAALFCSAIENSVVVVVVAIDGLVTGLDFGECEFAELVLS